MTSPAILTITGGTGSPYELLVKDFESGYSNTVINISPTTAPNGQSASTGKPSRIIDLKRVKRTISLSGKIYSTSLVSALTIALRIQRAAENAPSSAVSLSYRGISFLGAISSFKFKESSVSAPRGPSGSAQFVSFTLSMERSNAIPGSV